MSSDLDPHRPTEAGEYCHVCAQHRHFTVQSWWVRHDDAASTPFRWVVRRCTTCDEPHVSRETWRDAPYVVNDKQVLDGHWDAKVLYPKQRQVSEQVPPHIRKDYDEAQRCLLANADTAAALLLRRGLEQVCADYGIDDAGATRPLSAKLRHLHELGTLPDDLLDWASSLTLVGDEGAHSRNISRADVLAADRFFEALCDYLYAYRRQYEAFAQRRAHNWLRKPSDSS